MTTPARPTLRCLREDLDTDWDSVEDQRAVSRVETLGRPLEDLQHPIVRKAAEDFPVPAVERQREGISGLTDPMWWKVRSGARWRGAVYVDQNGQAWLCAAGYRRMGESSDFYKRFMAEVKARGADHFLPSDEDHVLLAAMLDAASFDPHYDARFDQWEAQLVVWIQTHASASLRSREVQEFNADDAFGQPLARVSVMAEAAGCDQYDVYVEVVPINFAALDELEWAEHVMLCALDPTEQQWETTYMGKGRAYSATISSTESSAEGSHTDATAHLPGQSVPGAVAHYAHRERLVDCMVDGDALRAVCGKWFVPRQDPDSREICPMCDLILAHLSPSD